MRGFAVEEKGSDVGWHEEVGEVGLELVGPHEAEGGGDDDEDGPRAQSAEQADGLQRLAESHCAEDAQEAETVSDAGKAREEG